MKTPEEVEKEVRELGWWYQHFRLPTGVWTGHGEDPAYQPETRWKIIEPYIPQDLSGQTVLDVGGNAGFFSIQMKLRGAARCVLVEPYQEFSRQAQYASREFGAKLEIVNEDVHTYCLTTEERFDYVLFLGLFYHLKYPGLVLDRLAEMTKRRIFFQSHLVGDEKSAYPDQPNYARGADDRLIEDTSFPRLAFIEKLYNGDSTNWWMPNYTALEPLIRSSGLRVVARPHPQVLVAEPEEYFGKTVYKKMVFPRYGKRGSAPPTEGQRLDPGPNELPQDLDFAARASEVGCGIGGFSYQDRRARILALDQIVPEPGLAQRRVSREDIHYLRPTGTDLPWGSASMDAVVANHVFEQVERPRRLAAEVSRVLKPDGYLLATAPDGSGFSEALYRWWRGGGDHVQRYTFRGFQEMVESAGNLVLLYACRLYSSFSFLNPDPLADGRRPRRSQLLKYLPRLAHLGSLTALNVTTRAADAMLGTRGSLYGWAFYFGKPGAVLTKVPEEEIVNVCAFCGYGHPGSRLERMGQVKRRFGLRTFLCEACGCRNPYFGPAWRERILARGLIEEEAEAPAISWQPSPRIPADPAGPYIESVTDALQFSPLLAPGTLIAVAGGNLASKSESVTAKEWPLEIGGTQLLVNGLPIPLSSISPTKIIALLPPTVARGKASFAVNCQGTVSQPRDAFLVLTAPSLPTVNAAGEAISGLFFNNSNWQPVTPAEPARTGEIVAFYAIGLGPVVPVLPAGRPGGSEPLSETTRRATVRIGNQNAPVEYCGLAVGLVGLYQVNVRVPRGLVPGDAPVVLKIGGRRSNQVRMAIGD